MNVKDRRGRAALTRHLRADATRSATRRRLLLAVAAWPALAWMKLVHAQPAKPPAKVMRVGILRSGTPAAPAPLTKLFIETMRELGWVEGRNVVYDFAYAEGDEARLPEAATALVARRPDVIYASNGPMAQAAFGRTRTIPIVFSSVQDSVFHSRFCCRRAG